MKNKLYFIVVFALCFIIAGLYVFDRYQIKNAAEKFTQEKITSTIQTDSNSNLSTIYCVGDSITLGVDGQTSYPEYLKQNINNPITTIAEKNINSAALAIQLGTLDVYVNNVTIPQDSEAVTISLTNKDGQIQNALLESKTGIEKCTIGDIEGAITYDSNKQSLVFTRSKSGDSLKITTSTQVKVDAPEIKSDSILILFTGSYEQSIAGSLITYQQNIIKAFNSDRYIVVSLTQNDRNQTNQLLQETYGDHYLDFKSYLINQGLQDAQIQATTQDKQKIAQNEIPSSLLTDDFNGNSQYNQLLANQLINKMKSLGYIAS